MKVIDLGGLATLYQEDCVVAMRALPDNSIDSCVTDPPYHLTSIVKRFGVSNAAPAKFGTDGAFTRASRGFMGRTWDGGDISFQPELWAEVWRVLKPGGYIAAFSGTRTYHRMAVAIEDAGFEIRDRIRFDQSFDTKFGPLLDSLNDEQRGMLLELLNDYVGGGSEVAWTYGSGFPKSHNQKGQWQGWGTALKPAWEPICLARKPLDGTVAANLAKWGTGALNIDGCRVGMAEGEVVSTGFAKSKESGVNDVHEGWKRPWQEDGKYHAEKINAAIDRTNSLGRWPANIVHDGSDEVLAAFPTSKDGVAGKRSGENGVGNWGYGASDKQWGGYGGSGSAARFFYCAKASRKDRDEGLEHLPKQVGGMVSNTSGQHITRRDEGYKPEPRANTHPTVKPTALMQWLCRLVTPPGGVILDPFMGSGSTGKAALLEGFKFIGIEKEDEYMPIAEARIAAALRPAVAQQQPAANDNQQQDLFNAA